MSDSKPVGPPLLDAPLGLWMAATPAEAYLSLPPGTPLDRFVLEHPLGRPGAFGIVYRAFDPVAKAPRALKLVLRDPQSTRERAEREYRTLACLPPHDRVVQVVEVGQLSGAGPHYLVFELLDGEDLARCIERGPLAIPEAKRLARELAEGFVHLHGHGVFHCDLKPANVVCTSQGAKLVDFNLAVSPVSPRGPRVGGRSLRYLPPDLDPSTAVGDQDLVDRDLYALGLTLYQAFTGRYPWESNAPPPDGVAPDPRDLAPELAREPRVCEFLLRAIAPHRAERFASALTVQESWIALGC